MTRAALALGLAALGLAACSKPRPPISDCVPTADARPICTFHDPEDFALLPQAHALVVSQMGGGDGSKPGSLVFFALESESLTPAYPLPGAANEAPHAGWGDPKCPGAPGAALSPHGLDLATRPDGALELLVVNHGGRESVELFEVSDALPPALAWRGCVLAPDDAFLNDVAALPDGGFVTTHFLSRAHPLRSSLLGLLRLSTGEILEWHADSGIQPIPGTSAPGPNGIAVSKDGETLYLDAYFADEVRKISRRTGQTLEKADIASPDNLNWTAEGKLLVASHNAPLNEILACATLEHGQCPFHFSIVLLDPARLSDPHTIYENVGPPMGAGTSALLIDGELYVGSFAGDRLLRVTLADWALRLVASP
ncbi:MAG TPA: hypothetical protein VMR50_09825 [Myxococcota bacterium]|nr:hypothetical protein [Myxococcota bacterium]